MGVLSGTRTEDRTGLSGCHLPMAVRHPCSLAEPPADPAVVVDHPAWLPTSLPTARTLPVGDSRMLFSAPRARGS